MIVFGCKYRLLSRNSFFLNMEILKFLKKLEVVCILFEKIEIWQTSSEYITRSHYLPLIVML